MGRQGAPCPWGRCAACASLSRACGRCAGRTVTRRCCGAWLSMGFRWRGMRMFVGYPRRPVGAVHILGVGLGRGPRACTISGCAPWPARWSGCWKCTWRRPWRRLLPAGAIVRSPVAGCPAGLPCRHGPGCAPATVPRCAVAGASCEQCVWDVVALAALSAVDRGRFTLRAASRRQVGSGSTVGLGLGPCAHTQVVAIANFWARLQGFAHLGVPRAGWGAVGPTHPFLRVVGGRLRCVV